MLTALQNQVKNNNANIQIGVIVFGGDAKTSYPLQAFPTTDDTLEGLKTALRTKPDGLMSGSNMHAGLLAAQEMLNRSTTAPNRKYVILVSDGLTRLFTGSDGKTKDIYYHVYDNNFYGMIGEWETVRTGNPQGTYAVPYGNWDTYFSRVKGWVKADVDKYALDYQTYGDDVSKADVWDSDTNQYKDGFTFIEKDDYENHAMASDRAVYEAYYSFAKIVDSGYHCYAVLPGSGTPFGTAFMGAMNEYAHNSSDIDFTSIGNDILYAVDKGSKVEDVIGNDFTLDVDSLSIYVGDDKLAKQAVANADNTWAFGDTTKFDRFTVAYNADTKTLTWKINEPITNFACVQLKYNVKLTNLPTQPGSHTSPTNERATLHPVGSNHVVGQDVAFPKPEVSYTVYTLNYDANGGSGAPAGEVNRTGNFTVSDTAPTRDGYVFAGWNTEVDGSGTNCAAGSGIERSEDSLALTLYAQWNKLVTVSFDLCGHGGANIPSQTFVSGNKASEPAAPKEDGWVFGGWYTEKGCQYRFSFDSAVTSDITLYAKWDRVTTVVSAPVATPTPTPTPSPAPAAAATKTATVKNAAIPQTSDVFPMEGLLALLAVGAVGFGAAGWLRKKHH